jgi:hypothetical protein
MPKYKVSFHGAIKDMHVSYINHIGVDVTIFQNGCHVQDAIEITMRRYEIESNLSVEELPPF